ncbi:MAG: hypothetical protein OXI05_10305 [Bacteroidota bacterium]|nr:hypothetical protein [Bacteroidota bacterium]MXW13326.1 hypothetical protein [Rhodothermaceae bacterium]MDE2646209.1 hypothetical protein [Bacteroidota bacterium]MXW33675.1 hypothetical protein [Rhodothermaceae bacterium]MXZ16859.1 hypothetical protein [Rhodothermaceae bacterium]
MSDWNLNQGRFKKVNEPLNQLEQLFQTFFEEQFANAKVELIQVREPFPFEDEDYFRVKFVYSSTGELDPEHSLSFIRLIRPKLEEINEERFPVLSFIEYEDYLENSPEGVVV